MINLKKGQINLTGSGVFAIVIILILLILIYGIAYILYLENQEYEEQFSFGENLLDSLSIYTTYLEPEEGSTKGSVSALINSSLSIDNIIIIPSYNANSFDKSKHLNLYKGEKEQLKNPHNLPIQSLDTSKIYEELGQGAKVCASVLLEYQDVNWIGRFLGKPKKTLENCKDFKTTFE